MLDAIEDTVTTDAAVTTDTDTSDTAKLIEELKKDNFTYRQKLKTLKTTVEELTEQKTLLETAKAEWEQELAARKASEHEALVVAELDKANITDAKARELALKLLKDYDDVSEGITAITVEYPFLSGKSKVVLPDTGKAATTDKPIPEKDRLATGLGRLIKDK